MNRILFESGEISDGIAVFGGVRAQHVVKVLHGEVGQVLKTGEIDGLIGTSVIESIEETVGGFTVKAKVSHDRDSLRPWVDLVLAPPRPRVMKRLLPQLSAMGVGKIVLVGAKKVEKDFWGATLLKEENYRPLLVEGLMQAGTSILPALETRRNFRRFVKEELETVFPDEGSRIVAHPYGKEGAVPAKGVTSPKTGRLLLSVGPEGGWTEDEVELMEEYGFVRYSLGDRILRTDTALIALLSRLEAWSAT
jgi:RsmE family RNA methyltransferase